MTTRTDHTRFLVWLDRQADQPGDLGALARAHTAGQVSLDWPDFRGEPTAVVAAAKMARESFDRLDALGVLRADGTFDDDTARHRLNPPPQPRRREPGPRRRR